MATSQYPLAWRRQFCRGQWKEQEGEEDRRSDRKITSRNGREWGLEIPWGQRKTWKGGKVLLQCICGAPTTSEVKGLRWNEMKIVLRWWWKKKSPYLVISLCLVIQFIWAASWQIQQSDCAPCEDSDQPAHVSLAFFLLLLKCMLISWKTLINFCPVQNHCSCEDTDHFFCPTANGGLLASLNQFHSK